MTTPNYRSPTAETGHDTGAGEQAKQTVGTTAEQGKHVAEVAKDEARQVTSEATQQARNLVGEVRTQLEDQSRSQRDRLVSTLRTFSDDLEQMSSKSDAGLANDLVQQGARRVRSFTDNMEGREPSELLDEVRRFARRKPGTFLIGALVAGVVAGRLARGARDAGDGPHSGTTDLGGPQLQAGSSSTTSYPTGSQAAAPGASTGSSGTPAGWSGERAESGHGDRQWQEDPLGTHEPLRSDGPLRGNDPLQTGEPLPTDDPTRRGPA